MAWLTSPAAFISKRAIVNGWARQHQRRQPLVSRSWRWGGGIGGATPESKRRYHSAPLPRHHRCAERVHPQSAEAKSTPSRESRIHCSKAAGPGRFSGSSARVTSVVSGWSRSNETAELVCGWESAAGPRHLRYPPGRRTGRPEQSAETLNAPGPTMSVRRQPANAGRLRADLKRRRVLS